MAEQGVILICIDTREQLIGVGRAPELPQWRDQQFHSSDPAIPLNDRSPRFLSVAAVYRTSSRPELAIVDIRSAHMNRERIPPIRVLGHDVEIRSDLGTTSGRESHPVTPFWEVRVDGETIGGVDGAIKNLDELGNAAIELATGYITQMTAEATHKF